jgi:photosystem II stability/assembly factor-like uncharacterized protein
MRLLRLLVAAVVAASACATLTAAQGWVNITGSLAYKLSECGTMTLVSVVPGSNAIIGGIAGRGLWINTSGSAWTRLGETTSERIANRPTWIVYDPQDPNVFWESGIYGDVGIYKTTDGGKTFRRLGAIAHNDYVSVDFTDPERRTLLAGGHEQSQTVHLSIDGGKTWRNVGSTIPPGTGATTHPYVLDAVTFLANTSSVMGGVGGIYRSANGGETWQRVSTLGPGSGMLRASNGVLYWVGNSRMARSTDRGVTWTPTGEGLKNVTPVEVPGGKLVAVGPTTLMITANGGATWSPLGPPLPYIPDGLAYSPQRNALIMWHGDCKEHVPANAVMQLDYDAK